MVTKRFSLKLLFLEVFNTERFLIAHAYYNSLMEIIFMLKKQGNMMQNHWNRIYINSGMKLMLIPQVRKEDGRTEILFR